MKRKIIITMKTSRRLTTFCLTGALTLAASGGALAAGNDAALQALFAQANYWHEKSHDELAMESLQKVLSVDANNTQAAVSDGALVAAGRRYAGGGAVARASGESGP
ncbi:Cellulose synthase operon protein C [Klebsiella pneumoniae]|nr:Cellulose synthase operon protein C [Klebsiella pneumoniae]